MIVRKTIPTLHYSLISVLRESYGGWGVRGIGVSAKDFNDHVRNNAKYFEDQHGASDFGVMYKEGE